MRCLGIDYGLARRWGLAYGDDLGVATPLPALVEGTRPSAGNLWLGSLPAAA